MNIYVVVEGRGDKKVYEEWVPLVNPSLSYVENAADISNSNFTVVSAHGYPFYFGTIEAAIEDVNSHGNIDRLVLGVDSEDMSFAEKMAEMEGFISERPCSASVYVVIQHFCLETWALGNRRVFPRSPHSQLLLEYRRVFNVLADDPELLPPYPKHGLNRAEFAEKYLRTILCERNTNLGYVKGNPKALLKPTYFQQVKKRLEETQHIASFATFLNAFN